MIKLKIISGQFIGQEEKFEKNLIKNGVKIDPVEIMYSLLSDECEWQIDFKKADLEEKFLWIQSDFTVRIVRAILSGRTIFFDNQRFDTSGLDKERIAVEIEDQIINSGRLVKILKDVSDGLFIDINGYEM